MTAARVLCILSGALCGAIFYYNKRDGLTADRLLSGVCHAGNRRDRAAEEVRRGMTDEDKVKAALRLLNEIHNAGRIGYRDYSDLFDAIRDILQE